jgi:predicted ATPase
VAAAYHAAAAGAVERFGGYAAHYLGDGLVAYFGYPTAHEDDAERAVRAGLDILDAIRLLNAAPQPTHGVELQVRIGIDTGPVVIGELGAARREPLALGDAPNVAARVQATAVPDKVFITETTHQLVGGLFLLEERGSHLLKGRSEPITLYRVLAPSGVRGRLDATRGPSFTPFVGREEERRLLLERWELVQEGQGQIVLITGEAGIGKSRLVRRLGEDLGGRRHTWIEGGGSPHLQGTAFAPVVDVLRQGLGWREDEEPAVRLARLERALDGAGLDRSEAVPLLSGLLGLELPDTYGPLASSPEQRRRRLMATLVQWVLTSARLQPMVLVLEDLHWIDPSTLELQALLVEQAATAPLLFVHTARPEFRPPWRPCGDHTHVVLNRLSRRRTREMVACVIGGTAPPPSHVLDAIILRSDGVPLFVEELTKTVLESGAAGGSQIPTTLQGSLMSRLDRLGTAKEVAQVASVAGREFFPGLLAAVVGLPAAALEETLGRLADAELIFVRGSPPDATYVFKHALIRDAAYSSLLKSRRRELHVAIARALADRFSDTVETTPELLAHHFTEAGELETAWRQWQRAGELAVARSALLEAAGHFTTALELLGTLPDTPGRVRQALNLQVLLGQAQAATKGYGARDVTDAFARARELARQAGGTRELLSVLFGLWTSIAGQGEFGVARDLADELLAVAERAGMRTEMVWGHLANGVNHYSLGDPTAAREHLARVVVLYREVERPPSPSDPGVMALSYATVNSWTLGLVEEARERSRESLELAQHLGNPLALAWAGFFTAALHVFLREPRRALEHVDPLITLCEEHQFSLFVGLATIVRGAALSEDGRHDEGLAELRKGLVLYRATGQRVSHRLYLCWLAQAYAAAGAVEEAAATVDEALGMPTEERLFEPELHRLRAELLGRRNAEPTRVEASFREAIELARRQAARPLELRAATSYAGWLSIARRGDEGRQHLEEVCGWFPAASDTRDLHEARALLRELTV